MILDLVHTFWPAIAPGFLWIFPHWKFILLYSVHWSVSIIYVFFYFIYIHYYYYVPLQIWRINTKYNVLYVHGPCIPGPNHCYVRIMDTTLFYRKHAMEEQPPYMPTFYPEDAGDSALPEEILDEKLFNLKDPSILYEEEMKVVKKAKR